MVPADEVNPYRAPSARFRSPRGWVLAVGVVAVLLVAGAAVAVVSVSRGGVSAAAGQACPASQAVSPTGLAVPARPSAATAAGALTPDRAPTSMLVCEYRDDDVSGIDPDADPSDLEIALSRSAEVDGGDTTTRSMMAGLRSAPVNRAAQSTGGSSYCLEAFSWTSAPSLLAVRYDDGVVWIATPGPCGAGSTNGVASSPVDFSEQVILLLDRVLGARPTLPGASSTAQPQSSSSDGVPVASSWDELCGSDTFPANQPELVPWRPVTVSVCHRLAGEPEEVASPRSVDHPESVAVALADQLDTLPEDVAAGGCDPLPDDEAWALLFTDSNGEQALLYATAHCSRVTNGRTARVADATLLAYLTQLSPR